VVKGNGKELGGTLMGDVGSYAVKKLLGKWRSVDRSNWREVGSTIGKG